MMCVCVGVSLFVAGKDHSVAMATSAPTSPIPPDTSTMSRQPLRGSKCNFYFYFDL